MEDIAEMMTLARLEAGLSQGELAQILHTDRTCVTRWERGGRIPTLITLTAWAEATGRKLEVRFV